MIESPGTGHTSTDDLLDAARHAAGEAARVHQERGRLDSATWTEKGRSDFVTEVDIESERRIVSILRERFPDHHFLAEEGTDVEAAGTRAPVRWIIDPLDGTTNWLHGYPEHSVSIAAEDDEGLLVGVVLNSASGELFEAARGGGARLDGTPISASSLDRLDLALVGTGFPFKKLHALPDYLQTFSRILRSTAGVRRAGSASLDLCDLACGRLDAFWEYWLMPWDVAAGALIVREAGGVFEELEVPGIDGPAADTPVGSESPGGLGPGAFLGANANLIDEFRSLVAGSLPGE